MPVTLPMFVYYFSIMQYKSSSSLNLLRSSSKLLELTRGKLELEQEKAKKFSQSARLPPLPQKPKVETKPKPQKKKKKAEPLKMSPGQPRYCLNNQTRISEKQVDVAETHHKFNSEQVKN